MITVIGLGLVGLTTALGFCEKGNKVYGYDIDSKKIELLRNKEIPFFESDLQKILKKNLDKNFYIVSSLEQAIKSSKVIVLCVGTPSNNIGKTDLKYIKLAIDIIVENINKNDKKVVVIKSTVPPSTTRKEIIPYIQNKGFVVGKDIYVANNPEFLREGYAWNDFINSDRIVIGADDKYSRTILKKIYTKFNVPIHFVTLNTGEFIKYLSNTFLSMLISYSNEMSMIADKIGNIDIKTAFKIFQEDRRWYGNPANMNTYSYPGCGFGGYCLPKDTKALIQKSKEYKYDPKILNDVVKVNNEIKQYWVEKIKKNVLKKSSITILGLSFKPESSDVRQSSSFELIKLLLKAGYTNIVAYDPVSNELFDKMYKLPIKYATTLEQAVKMSNTIVIATGWKQFIDKKHLYKNKKIFDLRYIL